ncbi:hypothetical protein COU24_03055 [Candidatus Kuenenbacteria bacterium CG10_big_fil_rev_8_21_14_0_10_39_14]|uniref:Uncharacterized protein n=2 Tax=Candidatus Kueneniibacteriota TaxID=1752740 RepID=A0A2H0D114_9BACT|nr:MAG: hypothetical protein COW86_01370 [Candidatus Kuenenbacteria bacterium CG22_combo_CG10-13_8_21_14_all_39_9]PIR80607.1 MAG: hypothetical protein COU24_03055 [Candidatus Kuenenbacteria bacterium CG10_big_fil_rev_8_21_14_0_10_39_14]
MPNTAYLATQKRKFEYFFIFYKALFQFFKRKEQECLVPAHRSASSQRKIVISIGTRITINSAA